MTRSAPHLLLLASLSIAAIAFAVVLFPHDLPSRGQADFVDVVFESRAVIWSARLLLVSAGFVLALGGLYIALSTLSRIEHREWLKRAGPFEVAETAKENLESQVEFWRAAALEDRARLQQMGDDLAESNRLIAMIQLALSDR